MDRRSFLRTSALGGTAAAGTLAAPAYAQGKRTLVMHTTWPRGFAGLADAADKTAENINAIAGDTLTVEVKHAGEPLGAFDVFDVVTAGQADMFHGADYYWVNQHPAYAFFASVPFGMTANELNAWYYHDGGFDLHQELGQIFGLKSFLAGNTGSQAGGWFRKEITSPEDFQGLRFRMPGLGGNALGAMGASVQNLPGGEIYQALASGSLDGTEWVGPWSDEKVGFQEVTEFYYPAGFHEPGTGLALSVNLDVFNELTPTQQKAIELGCAAANDWSLTQYLANNGAALRRLESSGVKIMEFPDSVWDAFGAASKGVYEEFMEDELFKQVFDSYMTSMGNVSPWISRSSGAYRAQRDRVLGV
ncbi:MAG: TRAP transporter substrate-binding protein [Rhodobacteraceae bacterium]|nr:TRAP transporter substrate-binding protein [Paracoccaceae bacterium]